MHEDHSDPASSITQGSFNAAWLELQQQLFVLPRLSPAFTGFRLIHISDIHMGTWINRERLEEVVEVINQMRPDVVAVTGDFVNYRPGRSAGDLIPPLKRLAPREAVLGVLGNHDHRWSAEEVAAILRESDVVHLANDIYTIDRGGACLIFAGVDSYYYHKDRLDQVLDKISDQWAAILLAHEPDFADISAGSGRFDLQLSGHSHGGQLVFPGIGSLFFPRYSRKYPRGRYHINGMIQYTNRGLGTSHLPLRINCPPEVTVIDLLAPD